MSDDEHEEGGGPSEAELALQKRRQGGTTKSKGLTETDKELLATNKEDRQRMDEEIKELRQRAEKRKKEREEEEKRLAGERAAEEERRKAVEDEKKKKKEEEERKRKEERAKKMAEFDKFKNPTGPNFVISKRGGGGGSGEAEGEGKEKKSKEQLDAEKKAILKQRIVPLSIDGMDQSGLAEKAKELHKLICRLEGEKYDLEKRFKTQQVDMQELAERARQANKVGKEGLKRAQIAEGDSDIMQERFAGTPAKVEMFSKYERQKDKRNYKDRKTMYTGPCYVQPPDRIKPNKAIKWNESGMPTYEDLPEGGAPPPAAAAEAGGEEE